MTTDSVLSAVGLGKRIAGRNILRGVSFDVAPGNVIGVLGKNGAGKSTLLDVLLGFALPTAGGCSVFAEDSASLHESTKARIGFVPQQDELIAILTGTQQLALTASFHRNWDHGLIARLAASWEVPLDRTISSMSGGERQKLSTLLALGHHPELLVLDEPASSLDPIARRRFMQEILAIAADGQRTVLYSSHIVSDIERVANLIWILRDGALVWQGDLDSLKESVIRLHLRGSRPFDTPPALPQQLSCRVQGNVAVIVVSHWRAEDAEAIAARLGVQIEVESLSLEDIFLELHA